MVRTSRTACGDRATSSINGTKAGEVLGEEVAD